ncbi:MAG: sugar transferase [Eubacterium sp.]|nr:sugar transferase [Eubacterium sp.]
MGKFNKNANIHLRYVFLDIYMSIVASLLAFGIYYANVDGNYISYRKYFVICSMFIFLYIMLNFNLRIYNRTLFFYVDRVLAYISRSFLISTVYIFVAVFLISDNVMDVGLYGCFLAFDYCCMILSAYFARKMAKMFRYDALRTLFVGSKDTYSLVMHYIARSNMNFDYIGYVPSTDGIAEGDETQYIGSLDNLEEIIHKNMIDQVFFMRTKENPKDLEPYVQLCMRIGVSARVVFDPFKYDKTQNYVSSLGTYPLITYHTVDMDVYSRIIKRMFDFAGSLAGIVLFSPIMLITALLVKLESKGPVIFRQKRVGLNGRQFYMYKFRSMCEDAEEKKSELMDENRMQSGLMFKMENDPRVTKVGRFIRKTSIDELPQFFNVLVGNMSLVGTRPPTIDEVEQYETDHWRRLSIKPGITGMWQVNGRSNITDFDEVVALDTEYIDNWSVWLDIRILFKTFTKLFVRDNDAY